VVAAAQVATTEAGMALAIRGVGHGFDLDGETIDVLRDI
jgi:hypothetical protein